MALNIHDHSLQNDDRVVENPLSQGPKNEKSLNEQMDLFAEIIVEIFFEKLYEKNK